MTPLMQAMCKMRCDVGSASSSMELAVHRGTLSGLIVLSTPHGSFQYISFRHNLNLIALRTQTKNSKYGKYGYQSTARAPPVRRDITHSPCCASSVFVHEDAE